MKQTNLAVSRAVWILLTILLANSLVSLRFSQGRELVEDARAPRNRSCCAASILDGHAVPLPRLIQMST